MDFRNFYIKYSEDELLIELKNGNERAFDEIYKRYWNVMFQSAYNVLRNRESCMDIVQELFIWLWEHRENLEIHSLKSYLLVAVKFKVISYIRKDKVKESFFDKIKQIGEPSDLITESLEVKDLMDVISRFVEKLPERCKEVYMLSRNEYLTNKQIAERLGVSVKTVENHMTIALKKIKTTLGKASSLIVLLFISFFQDYFL